MTIYANAQIYRQVKKYIYIEREKDKRNTVRNKSQGFRVLSRPS